jgi:putative ABC transport system ATP-binding protein
VTAVAANEVTTVAASEVPAVAASEVPAVRLSSVGYTYDGPRRVRALKPLSLEISQGEHVAVLGPSGAGKSTLLNLLGLLDRPTQGTVEIDGVDVGAAPERDRAAVRARRIGFVCQACRLLPYRTAAENVMLAQVYAGVPRRQRLDDALAALARVGLDGSAQALPGALSDGERRRLAIARALVNQPTLLLCDEPAGNLDSGPELSDLLAGLHRDGATLVVGTRDSAAAQQADRTILMRGGELIAEPARGRPPRSGTCARAEPPPTAGQAASEPGEHPVTRPSDPDAIELDAIELDAIVPVTAEPEIIQREATEPEATEPDAVGPDAVGPAVTDPVVIIEPETAGDEVDDIWPAQGAWPGDDTCSLADTEQPDTGLADDENRGGPGALPLC